jgi:hypothetical protein
MPCEQSATAFHDTIQQGADWVLAIVDQQPDGTPTDLSGCVAILQCRRKVGDTEATLELTTDQAGGITIDEEGGIITIRASAAQTAAMAPGRHLVQLDVTWLSNVVERPIDGSVTVVPSIISA